MTRTSGFSCKSITVYICILQTDIFFKRKKDMTSTQFSLDHCDIRGFLVPARHPSASRSRGVNPHELPMSQVNVRCFSTVAFVASDTWILLDPFQSRLEGWPPLFFDEKHNDWFVFQLKMICFFSKVWNILTQKNWSSYYIVYNIKFGAGRFRRCQLTLIPKRACLVFGFLIFGGGPLLFYSSVEKFTIDTPWN